MQLMFNFDEPGVVDVVKEETEKVFDKNPELDDLSLDDLAKIIIKETGIQFVKEGDKYIFRNKKYKKEASFKYGRFNYYSQPCRKGGIHKEKYIGCDYAHNLGGCHCPERTIKDAINFFNRNKERLNKKEEN